ncbi:hypothetical protein EsH8_VIII_001073 [Colletotrichum jinshuiense]
MSASSFYTVQTAYAMGDDLKRLRPQELSDPDDRSRKRQATPDVVPRNDSSGAFHRTIEPSTRSELHGTGIQHSGSGSFNARDIYFRATSSDCDVFKDLHVTDPRHDKKRIQDTNGGLLKDSYVWVLQNPDFCQWRDDQNQRLLWAKGDPGKGKTMLLCGIIDELEATRPQGKLLSYFFCQAPDERLNTATAVLRGLIFMLLDQDPSLVSYIKKKYDTAGKALFQDVNAWQAISEIFTNMLHDPKLQNVCLLVDALDECLTGLEQLLNLITETLQSTGAKWLVSSRNWSQIEERLCSVAHRLSLELNEKSVSVAVDVYIKHKVKELAKEKKYSPKLRKHVFRYLSTHAGGTFLWAALVCQELKAVPEFEVRKRIETFPPGLDTLYQRMMQQICDSSIHERCKQFLAVTVVAYRPLSLIEYVSVFDQLNDLSGDTDSDDSEWEDNETEDTSWDESNADLTKSIQKLVSLCGSFLTIREDTVYFVHQSAKDFLLNKNYKAFEQILPSGIAHQHYIIFLRSLDELSITLRRDIYKLRSPGVLIEDVALPDPDPLARIKYSCTYWVDHLEHSNPAESPAHADIQDNARVYTFLKRHYLYWLEAQSLLQGIPQAVIAMQKLETLVARIGRPELIELIRDALRLILSYKQCIEKFPLQLYTAVLLFSPTQSVVRRLFQAEAPAWITVVSEIDANWNACLQTLEGHNSVVNSVAFSPDGRQLASASNDETIKVWDTATGQCQQTLEGHSSFIWSVAFSPDGRQLASASIDETIKVWDTATGQCQQTLEGHSSLVWLVAFSPDGRQLASASDDETVKLWDTATGQCQQTLEGHSSWVRSVAFSPDGRQLASASDDNTVKLWDTATGQCQQTLEGHSSWVGSVAFSPDRRQLASASNDETVKLWDTATGQCQQTLEGHSNSVSSVAFSPDGRQLASASSDDTVKLWDTATGQCQQTLEGHSNSVSSVAFSPDGRQLASASDDKTIKIWDTAIVQCQQTLEGHSNSVWSVAFSPDGRQLASASIDNTVKLWDTATGQCQQTLEGHSSWVRSVAFSPDGRQLASVSDDETVKLWDTATGQCQQTLEGHSSWVRSVAFSPDGRQLASASDDETVKIWDTSTGQCQQTLEGYSSRVRLVAFSPDGRQLASVSDDNTVKLWDTATGQCQQTLEGHSSWVGSVAFSPDGRQLASAFFDDDTVKIWDTSTGQCQQTLEDHSSLENVFKLTIQKPSQGPYDRHHVLSQHGVWIKNSSHNMLWLPPGYRAECHAVEGSRIAVGCESGRVLLLQFALEG